MTKRQALQVLLEHAGRDCRGSGVGIRSIPSDAEQTRVALAIVKLFPLAFEYPCSNSALSNYGVPQIIEE